MSADSTEVLLLRPPRHEFADAMANPLRAAARSYPIGLAYLAAALRQADVSVRVLDAWAAPGQEAAAPPRELAYLDALSDLRYCGGPARYYREGMPQSQIETFVRRHASPIIGISSMFSGYHLDALRLADSVRRLLPDAKIVLGGAAVTASPELTLRHDSVDFVVLGEGETSFPLLARALLSRDPSRVESIPGIGFKKGGVLRLRERLEFIPDLDALPRPAHDLMDHSFYRVAVEGKLEPYAALFTSRGCPHRCDFCTIYLSMGRAFRVHSPRRVLEEIRRCRDRYDIRTFHIEDDNFAFDPERAKAILRLIIREFGPRRLILRSLNGMTALSLRDPELVTLMAEAGFDHVMIALESEDAAVRRTMMKPGTVAHFTHAVEACETAGMRVGAFTIIGLPYSTVAKDVRTQLFSLTQKMRAVAPIIFYPIPRTPQYDRCVREGWIKPETRFLPLLSSETSVVRRPGYSRRDAFTLINLAALFNEFKAAAPDFKPARAGCSVWDVLRRHGERHPVRASPGRLESDDAGRGLWDCCRLFFQIEKLLRKGELVAFSETGAARARFKKARASRRVVARFVDGLRANPMRYLSGEEIVFDDPA